MPGNGEKKSQQVKPERADENVISWSSLVEMLTRRMFARDKSGRTIFFPWGPRRKGYVLQSARQRSKIAEFYAGSIAGYIALLGITIGSAAALCPIMWGLVLCSAIWLAVWSVYANSITHSLPAARRTYYETVLEKLSQDADEYVPTESELSMAARAYVSPSAEPGPLLSLKALYYRLSPAQAAAGPWAAAGIVAWIWYSFHPSLFEGQYGFYLGAATLFILAGLGSFLMLLRAETSGLLQFVNWKLPQIMMTVVCWSGAIYMLFKYFVRAT